MLVIAFLRNMPRITDRYQHVEPYSIPLPPTTEKTLPDHSKMVQPEGILKTDTHSLIRNSQIKGKYFSVVIEDTAKADEVIRLIRVSVLVAINWPDRGFQPRLTPQKAGGYVKRDHRDPKVRYIVIDLHEYVSIVDVPFDEPKTAFSCANMVRTYGNLYVHGRLISPKQSMPRVVPAYWVPLAAQGYTEIPWIE